MMDNDQENYLTGAEAIVYRENGSNREYLVVAQKSSGNISFAGGMSEEIDNDTDDTMVRELDEELNLIPDQYSLKKTNIVHDFIYGDHPTRSGQRIKKQVYIIKINDGVEVTPNKEEVKDTFWVDEAEAYEKMWSGVKEIFKKAIEEI